MPIVSLGALGRAGPVVTPAYHATCESVAQALTQHGVLVVQLEGSEADLLLDVLRQAKSGSPATHAYGLNTLPNKAWQDVRVRNEGADSSQPQLMHQGFWLLDRVGRMVLSALARSPAVNDHAGHLLSCLDPSPLPLMETSSCTLQVHHYNPACPLEPSRETGCAAHQDRGFLTVIASHQEGLEILPLSGSWQPVRLGLGQVAVLPGLCLQHATAKLVRATWHRVELPSPSTSRTSLAFKLHGRADALIRPADILLKSPRLALENQSELVQQAMTVGEVVRKTWDTHPRSVNNGGTAQAGGTGTGAAPAGVGRGMAGAEARGTAAAVGTQARDTGCNTRVEGSRTPAAAGRQRAADEADAPARPQRRATAAAVAGPAAGTRSAGAKRRLRELEGEEEARSAGELGTPKHPVVKAERVEAPTLRSEPSRAANPVIKAEGCASSGPGGHGGVSPVVQAEMDEGAPRRAQETQPGSFNGGGGVGGELGAAARARGEAGDCGGAAAAAAATAAATATADALGKRAREQVAEQRKAKVHRTATPADPPLMVTVRDQFGEEMHFKVQPRTKMCKVFHAWCERMAVREETMRFVSSYDFLRVSVELTAEEYMLRDGSVIDALESQNGD